MHLLKKLGFRHVCFVFLTWFSPPKTFKFSIPWACINFSQKHVRLGPRHLPHPRFLARDTCSVEREIHFEYNKPVMSTLVCTLARPLVRRWNALGLGLCVCAVLLISLSCVLQAKAQLGKSAPQPGDSPSSSPANPQPGLAESSASTTNAAASSVAPASLEVKEAAQKVAPKAPTASAAASCFPLDVREAAQKVAKKPKKKKHSAPVSHLAAVEVYHPLVTPIVSPLGGLYFR